MPGMWAAVIMIVTGGRSGDVAYLPFYDMTACQNARAEIRAIAPYAAGAVCVTTVTGNPGKHNGQ